MTTLSINIIAKDGAQDLSELIPLIKSVADEIVVIVDDRTTDDTVDVATKLGCKVVMNTWAGFCDARNKAIENSSMQYIAWFDCDDRPEDVSALARFKSSNLDLTTIYTFGVRNIPGTIVFNQVRMFPRHQDIRFVYRVHETISAEAIEKGFVINTMDVIVDHHGYKHAEDYTKKLIRNLPEIEAEIQSGSFCPTLRYTYSMNLLQLGYQDQAMHFLMSNMNDRVKNSPFRDVWLFSVLNYTKTLFNRKLYNECEHWLIQGLLALPDFKEFHLLRAQICYITGDFLTCRTAINIARQCPERTYAIATEWTAVNATLDALANLVF